MPTGAEPEVEAEPAVRSGMALATQAIRLARDTYEGLPAETQSAARVFPPLLQELAALLVHFEEDDVRAALERMRGGS